MKPRNTSWVRPFGPGEHSVKPITGSLGRRIIRIQQGWSSQTPQERASVLPYFTRNWHGRMTHQGTPQDTYYPVPDDGQVPYLQGWGSGDIMNRAMNKAYADFIDKFQNGSAQLGASIAEGREAFDMISKRSRSLYNAYRNLRRGNLKGALGALSVQPKRKHRNVARTSSSEASALWLEYHFGWSPMLGDIYDAAGVLLNPAHQPPSPLVGFGKVMYPYRSSGANSSSDSYSRKMSFEGTAKATTGGLVVITSFNSVERQRLGMANPASVAWEVVPFSFVVDWMFSVGNVVGAWTDLIGTRIISGFQTRVFRGTIIGSYGALNAFATPSTYRWVGAECERKLGLAGPVLTRPRLIDVASSHTRAVTSASLLRQVFMT